MKRVVQIFEVVFLASLSFVFITVGMFVRGTQPQVREILNRTAQNLRELSDTMQKVRDTMDTAKAAAAEQKTYWAQNSQATGALLNNASLAVGEFRAMVTNLDTQLTGETVPALTAMLKQSTTTITQVGKSFSDLAAQSAPGIENMNLAAANAARLTGDPNLPATLASMQLIAANTAEATGHIAGTTKDLETWTHNALKPASMAKRIASGALDWAYKLKALWF